jgi:sporulation protein YlmC with PRC-barrel domain
MATERRFTIGAVVEDDDGVVGRLRRVVIDPVAQTLTHLVVEPRQHGGGGRLVPIELVDGVDHAIRLKCSRAEYDGLEAAEETQFFDGAAADLDYEEADVLSQPYFPLAPAPIEEGVGGMGMGDLRPGRQAVAHDRVPPGEVQVKRGEQVHATDGAIGRVRGLVVDPRDNHVTHVLLDGGHLWGKKRVAIPIGAVTKVEENVRGALTKAEVRDLPAVELGDDA